jgi:hypothetical protein
VVESDVRIEKEKELSYIADFIVKTVPKEIRGDIGG